MYVVLEVLEVGIGQQLVLDVVAADGDDQLVAGLADVDHRRHELFLGLLLVHLICKL